MPATIISFDGTVIEVTSPAPDAGAATQPLPGLATATSAALRSIARGRAPVTGTESADSSTVRHSCVVHGRGDART